MDDYKKEGKNFQPLSLNITRLENSKISYENRIKNDKITFKIVPLA